MLFLVLQTAGTVEKEGHMSQLHEVKVMLGRLRHYAITLERVPMNSHEYAIRAREILDILEFLRPDLSAEELQQIRTALEDTSKCLRGWIDIREKINALIKSLNQREESLRQLSA